MRFSRSRSVLVVLALVGAFAASASVAAPAGADAIGDKQAQAEHISQRLSQLDDQMSLLAEQYDQARVRLDGVQNDIDQATRRLDAANTELGRRRSELASYAVEAYLKGGESDLPDILLKGSGPEVSRQIEYLQAASASRRQLVDDVRGAQASADQQLGELRTSRDQAQALRDQLDQKRAATERASAEQADLLSKVTGELGDLVAQAQARQAQAEQDAAKAKLVGSPAGQAPAAGAPAAEAPATGPTAAPSAPAPSKPTAPPPVTSPPVTTPSPVTPPTPPPPVTSAAAKAVARARTQLGVPYVWAGADPAIGFDCSGLVMWAYAGAGKSLPHSSQLQYQVTRRVAIADLEPGDLLFYGSPIHHVGMYVGGGQMIEAPHTGANVRIASIYRSDLIGAGRVV